MMALGYNRVLGDPNKPAEARPHRVAMANWPANNPTVDGRTASFEALCGHLAGAGYEGIEFSAHWLGGKYFPGDSHAVVARKARQVLEKNKLQNFGTTLHRPDAEVRQLRWKTEFSDQAKIQQDMGSEFISVQFSLHPDYNGTGGAYREDEDYLRWAAGIVADMREAVWALGMNFYLEVHMDRVTEDPAGCCRILDMCACELNGDMSHYLFRGIGRGKHLEKIMQYVHHSHVRMARKLGDLSAGVEDPKADWQQKGVTWQMFEMMKPALAHGLSSRTIAGETGPMHLVKDTLTQDASLVPLYRAMARYADAGAQGITMKVESPEDLKPWG